MKQWSIVLCLAVVGTCQVNAPAACPSGQPNEVFCENFDTYCVGGGYPGSTECVSGATKDDALLRQVWSQTSTDEFLGTACGELFVLDNGSDQPANPYYSSVPFAARAPGANGQLMGQQTFKDWVSPNPYNLSRFIGNTFGSEYTAVAGTDNNPLVLEYWFTGSHNDAVSGGNGWGKIWASNGYMELAYGDETYLNRANTDFGFSPYCGTYCSPSVKQGPFPILCASGNPDTPGQPLPANCPSLVTNPPPVHHAIAIGAHALMDNNPCHCGSGNPHGNYIYHLALYDGKLWYELKTDNPYGSDGTVIPVGDAPMPMPPEITEAPGDFTLSGGMRTARGHNWVKLTIKTSTLDVEFKTLEKSNAGYEYYVISTMNNIPRQYTGPFDRMRTGVGPGCELASNASWDTCVAGTGRHCVNNQHAQSRFVNFDDVVLYQGVGYSDKGACCVPNSDCINNVSQAECENTPAAGGLGGHWQGTTTTCSTTTCCPFTPYVFADADHDTDVDQDDFGMFQLCYTGSGGGVPSGCSCLNRNGDGGIDNTDFTEFKNCYTGANVPWTSSVTPSCIP